VITPNTIVTCITIIITESLLLQLFCITSAAADIVYILLWFIANRENMCPGAQMFTQYKR